MTKVLDIITKRSSIRAYKEDGLSNEIISTLVDAALKAPTARNEQELHISVVNNGHPVLKELQQDLNPNATVSWYYNAPVVLFISGKDDFKWSAVDAGIAVENVHLAATSLDLGSVILGCIDGVMHGEKQAHYQEILDIPEGYSFYVGIAVGKANTTKEPHNNNMKNVSYIK